MRQKPDSGARITDGTDPELRISQGWAVDPGYEPEYNKGPVWEDVGAVGNGWAAAMLPYTNQNTIGLVSGVSQALTNLSRTICSNINPLSAVWI